MNLIRNIRSLVLSFLAGTTLFTTAVQGANHLLPAPIFFEDFEKTPEGQIPAGWTATNFTSEVTLGVNLNDPTSSSYKGWLVLSRDRVLTMDWESDRRLAVATNQFVNGVLVTNLAQGKFIYAESDTRRGNQVQYLFSPDINLTGWTNVFIAYNSIYEQNQDSLGAVEYSIDGGTNWLPVVYMIDQPDIIFLENSTNIDAVSTLTEPRDEAAKYLDPVTFETHGGFYGAFIGATITQDLAPYISGRIDDDPIGSKLVEQFPLPAAANQPHVRLRFAQAGTSSWYFGIDNLGLYSTSPRLTNSPIKITTSKGAGTSLQFEWTGGGGPFLIQKKWSLTSTNWFDVSTTTNRSAVVFNDGKNGFYRIVGETALNVISLTAILSGAAERPSPVNTTASGTGTFSLAGTNLNFLVNYQGLSGIATASHIHGITNTTAAAPVLINMAPFNGGAFGSNGVISGSVGLTAEQRAALLSLFI
jgi:hypothetical protein